MAVDASLYPEIEGSTDTETLFFLALTFGLTDDPPAAVARAVGLVEDVGRRHGVEYPVHMTVATTDGESIWVVPLLQREGHELALLLDRRRPRCGGCIRSWTSSTAWEPTPASSSRSHCGTSPARGTRSRRARGRSSGGASRRSSRSSRRSLREPAGPGAEHRMSEVETCAHASPS